jgi:hypothetical protein
MLDSLRISYLKKNKYLNASAITYNSLNLRSYNNKNKTYYGRVKWAAPEIT